MEYFHVRFLRCTAWFEAALCGTSCGARRITLPPPPPLLIHSYYSLHSDPLDPEHIRAFQLVKLTRDCQMVGVAGSVLSEADPAVLEADVNVAFTAEVTRADKVAPGSKMERSALKMAPVKMKGATATADRKKVWFEAQMCEPSAKREAWRSSAARRSVRALRGEAFKRREA